MSDPGLLALELLEQANQLPANSPERVDLLEAAARHADAAGDLELAYRVRDRLIDAGIDAGEAQRGLVAFAWCLSQCDERPDLYPESDLHWRYKWVLEWMPHFAEISRSELEGLLADVEQRFRKRGMGQNAIAKLRMHLADFLGDHAELERWYETWKKTARDTLSDCHACDLDQRVHVAAILGRDSEAIAAARDLIGRGMRCAEVPALTYARALPALLRGRELETARAWHRAGFPLLKKLRKKRVGSVGEHLLYTAVRRDLGRGLRILRETLPLAGEHAAAYTQLTFLAGAQLLLERIARRPAKLTLIVPRSLGGSGVPAELEPAALAARFAGLATEIAARFDRRNGNQSISRRLGEWQAFRELELPDPHSD